MLEEKAYRDTWGKGLDSFIQWFYEMALMLRDLLAEVTELELQVYEVANGALTLWDIHLHLKISREQVWEAYSALLRLDLLEPAS